ncbi:MAG TPA: GNAT family N-acetyltransferase [Bacillota bacterium]|nr:GNAT family N-acetyltransferase [Bacillota bacterium]HPO97392.1 GNAT family N-acetyltransferase [Bacillota bacterium]
MDYIIAAQKTDLDDLNRIAYESEAYWDYDWEYMQRFKAIYRITEDYIKQNPTFILVERDRIIGFYSLLVNAQEVELEFFYIAPQYIGKGYGRRMWTYLIDYCKAEGIKSFFLVTSPQAQEFYEKMGAVKVGEVESIVRKGRRIPRLKFEVK